MLPVPYHPAQVQRYFHEYHNYEYFPQAEAIEVREYRRIDPADVKARILDYLGEVLARCWCNKDLMALLKQNPHECLLQLGIILPEELNILVEERRNNPNRPRLVVYEKQGKITKRVCHLQLMMTAGR